MSTKPEEMDRPTRQNYVKIIRRGTIVKYRKQITDETEESGEFEPHTEIPGHMYQVAYQASKFSFIKGQTFTVIIHDQQSHIELKREYKLSPAIDRIWEVLEDARDDLFDLDIILYQSNNAINKDIAEGVDVITKATEIMDGEQMDKFIAAFADLTCKVIDKVEEKKSPIRIVLHKLKSLTDM